MGKAKSKTSGAKTKHRSPRKTFVAKEDYTPDEHKMLIEAEFPNPADTTKTSFIQVSPSYWRVTYWGRTKENETIPREKIIGSKFIKISIDSIGRLCCNDVSDGGKI